MPALVNGGGTFHSATGGTFHSDMTGTFESDMGGTFNVLQSSNGAFLAQIIASRLGLPALLGNPYLEMTRFLIERIGEHEYKSPRTDGHQQLVINQSLIDEFAEVQVHQWDDSRPELSDRIWGLFGENDHLAHFEPLFLQHYTHAYHFPGGHTPTAEEVREYYALLAEKLYTQNNA